MKSHIVATMRRARLLMVALAIVAGSMVGGATLFRPAPAEAHCDSVNGPVVQAAQMALDRGDVRLVLPYVKANAESELTAAYNQTLEVRKRGPESKALADRYFAETAVRLHRAGEGASYTGLKDETDHGPALEAADKALEGGAIGETYAVLYGAIYGGVNQRYEAVVTARAHEAEVGTVEAARERAEAELAFEKYVYEIYQLASDQTTHAEGATTTPAHAG